MEPVTAELISRARAGDGAAFRELTAPYRRELQVHCYRMLGSLQDAEDALQDTLLAAWQGLEGFEGRASLRTWLYRIATNRCLNARRSSSRRPAKEWNVPKVEPPEPTRLGEVVWLEPYPDALLDGVIDRPLGPEARYEQAEAISLAFVTALQVLPPRQVAVLVLRDVLGFHAVEVADMLDSTVDSVNSALKRARAGLRKIPPVDGAPAPVPRLACRGRARGQVRPRLGVGRSRRTGRASHRRRLHLDAADPLRIRRAETSLPASSPASFGAGRRFDLVATRANGQPAFGAYLRVPQRNPPRDRPLRPHPRRRPDLRHDPLRQRRAPMVRAAAIDPQSIAVICRAGRLPAGRR